MSERFSYRNTVALEILKQLVTADLNTVRIGVDVAKHESSHAAILADAAFDIADEMWKESIRPHRVDGAIDAGRPRQFVIAVGTRYIDATGELTDKLTDAYEFSRPGAELYATENDGRFPGYVLEICAMMPKPESIG